MNEFTFTDSRFMTAQEKHRVIKAWSRFLKGGCALKDFTSALYEHLINHCSFIAHYNRHVFYSHYFSQPGRKRLFFSQFDKSKGCEAVEIGGISWLIGTEYTDINHAMVDVAAAYIIRIYTVAEDTTRQRDLTQAKALLLKHGLTEAAQQITLPKPSVTTGTQATLL